MKRNYQADLEICEKAKNAKYTATVSGDFEKRKSAIDFIELSCSSMEWYIKRCMDLEIENHGYSEALKSQQIDNRLLKQFNHDLEAQVGAMREALKKAEHALDCTHGLNCDDKKRALTPNEFKLDNSHELGIIRKTLQSPTPAMWEAMQKQRIMHEIDINSLKSALNEIDDDCVRYHECGPFDDKESLKRVMRIRDIAVAALAELERRFGVVQIDFSIFAKPIEEQLKKLGYEFKDKKDIDKYNKILKSWNMLRIHGIATSSEVDRMANRIMKMLSEDIVSEQQKAEEGGGE